MSSPPERWLIWYLKFSFLYYSCCHAKANFVVDTFEIVIILFFCDVFVLNFISGNIWSWKWSHTTLQAFSNLTQRRQSILSFLLTLTVCGAFYIFTWRGEDASARKTLMVDHPIAICFVYLVYMQRVVLVPSARIFLVLGSSYKINVQTVDRS